MRKYWLFMWLLLPSFAYAQISGQIRVPAEHVRYEKVMEYDKILWGDTYIKELGYPELPVVYKSYLIPKGAAHVNIEPRLTKAEQVNGTFRVYPVQKPQIPGGSSKSDFIDPVPLIYGSNTLFIMISSSKKPDTPMCSMSVNHPAVDLSRTALIH